MNEILSDDEQLEALKKWWKENGNSLIFGLAVAIAVVVGYRSWTSYQQRQAEAASAEYEVVAKQLKENGLTEGTSRRTEELMETYPGSIQTVFAGLNLAKAQVEEGKLTEAEAQIEAVLKSLDDDALKPLVILRLAQVELGLNKYDEALKNLNITVPEAYRALFSELKADVYSAKGDTAKAVELYRDALKQSEEGSRNNQIIELKLNALGETAS